MVVTGLIQCNQLNNKMQINSDETINKKLLISISFVYRLSKNVTIIPKFNKNDLRCNWSPKSKAMYSISSSSPNVSSIPTHVYPRLPLGRLISPFIAILILIY